jgi:hypothetical protein
METTNNIQRSELWQKIYAIVKQIPMRQVEHDAMDAASASSDIEHLFKNWNKHSVVRSLPDFKFTEWLGETYIRLNQVWVHRYSSQLHKENWKTTEELYELYLKQQGQ